MKWWMVVALLMCAGCDSESFTRQRHPDGSNPSEIYIFDSHGECYALRDFGRRQQWAHMKREACR
jgi:hypothetical protein